jgi:hypothetical protein
MDLGLRSACHDDPLLHKRGEKQAGGLGATHVRAGHDRRMYDEHAGVSAGRRQGASRGIMPRSAMSRASGLSGAISTFTILFWHSLRISAAVRLGPGPEYPRSSLRRSAES